VLRYFFLRVCRFGGLHPEPSPGKPVLLILTQGNLMKIQYNNRKGGEAKIPYTQSFCVEIRMRVSLSPIEKGEVRKCHN
jgi:hypothetical protein